MNFRSFWQIVTLSFYSPELYLTVARKWQHWGLGFLLRLSMLVATISSVLLFILLSSFDFSDLKLAPLFDQIPEIRIEKNLASLVDEKIKLPLRLKLPNIDQEIVIFDFSITDAEQYKQNIIVFTKDRIAFNFLNSPSFAVSYQEFDGKLQLINGEYLIKFLNEVKKSLLGMILFLGIPVGSLVCFFFNLFKSLFYASIAHIIIRISGGNLDFKQLTRIAVIANGPAIIISIALSLLFFATPVASIAQAVANSLYVFYFVFAVVICKKVAKY